MNQERMPCLNGLEEVTLEKEWLKPAASGAHAGRSAALLEALQARVDALGAEESSFVMSILASTQAVPRSLAELIVEMMLRRRPVRVGPVHHALADMFRQSRGRPPRPLSLGDEGLALIRACQRDAAANAALDFVLALPGLLHEVEQGAAYVGGPQGHPGLGLVASSAARWAFDKAHRQAQAQAQVQT